MRISHILQLFENINIIRFLRSFFLITCFGELKTYKRTPAANVVINTILVATFPLCMPRESNNMVEKITFFNHIVVDLNGTY